MRRLSNLIFYWKLKSIWESPNTQFYVSILYFQCHVGGVNTTNMASWLSFEWPWTINHTVRILNAVALVVMSYVLVQVTSCGHVGRLNRRIGISFFCRFFCGANYEDYVFPIYSYQYGKARAPIKSSVLTVTYLKSITTSILFPTVVTHMRFLSTVSQHMPL